MVCCQVLQFQYNSTRISHYLNCSHSDLLQIKVSRKISQPNLIGRCCTKLLSKGNNKKSSSINFPPLFPLCFNSQHQFPLSASCVCPSRENFSSSSILLFLHCQSHHQTKRKLELEIRYKLCSLFRKGKIFPRFTASFSGGKEPPIRQNRHNREKKVVKKAAE